MRNRDNSPPIRIARESEPFKPRAEDLRLVQQVARDIKNHLNELPSWYDYYVTNHQLRIAFDLQQIQRWFPADAPIADLGCSPLLLLAALHSRGYKVTGIDIDPARFAQAAQALGLHTLQCDFETATLPFEDGALSGVIMNEVFEHLRIDLIKTFREVRRVMRPGARLLLSTPNGASYSNLRNLLRFDRGLDDSVYENYQSLGTVGHMGHVREYTMSDVAEFLNSAGFACRTVIYRNRYPTNFQQLIARIWPCMRPHFTIMAERVG